MNYHEFLAEVQRSGCFTSSEETQAVVANVLMAVAECLPKVHLDDLAATLPPELRVYLRRTRAEPDPYFDSQLFLGWVVSSVDATGARDKTDGGLDLYAAYSGEEAIRRVQCVFSVLKSAVAPPQWQGLVDCLPEEVEGWLRQA